MRGSITVPGDKSISHRVAMVAAISRGECRLRNFNPGADCATTLSCLESLGTDVQRGEDVRILPRPWREPGDALDCGNSGSTIRMLTGLLAGRSVPAVLTGDASLLRRPMMRIAEPLRRMGAVLELHEDRYAPIVIKEGVNKGIVYRPQISSAQVKSAVLFAGLRFPETRVIEPAPSRDHTERLLNWLGFEFGQDEIREFEYDVPGDPSAAAFFVTAALLDPASDLQIRNVLLNPFRIGFVRVLQRSGARLEITGERMEQGEPVGDLRVRGGASLSPIVIEAAEVPSVIDEIPALSIAGTIAGFHVSGASELRYKESDRIAAMVENLRSVGLETQEYPDGYSIAPGAVRSSAAILTRGDHRIAMAFAAAGVEVDDPHCASISFPNFFELLQSLR